MSCPISQVIGQRGGGAAKAAAFAIAENHGTAIIYNRSPARADQLAREINSADGTRPGRVIAASIDKLPKACCRAFINCTPLGMAHGPDPDALSIPVHKMENVAANTVFFDTVYNPAETPMLRAARELGYPTIDGVQMFVKQAAAQFERWTGNPAPVQLFDRLCRERLRTS